MFPPAPAYRYCRELDNHADFEHACRQTDLTGETGVDDIAQKDQSRAFISNVRRHRETQQTFGLSATVSRFDNPLLPKARSVVQNVLVLESITIRRDYKMGLRDGLELRKH